VAGVLDIYFSLVSFVLIYTDIISGASIDSRDRLVYFLCVCVSLLLLLLFLKKKEIKESNQLMGGVSESCAPESRKAAHKQRNHPVYSSSTAR
jgi:hypothetical protein